MAWINGVGALVDGSPPPYDNMNGQYPEDPLRLRARNVRLDVQWCPQGYWATKEGVLIRIRAMSDRHIQNSMALLERKARNKAILEGFAAGLYAETAPDGAADAADEVSRELFEMAHDPETDLKRLAELVWPKYRELKLEMLRRA